MTAPDPAPDTPSDVLRVEQAYRVRFDEATPDGLAKFG